MPRPQDNIGSVHDPAVLLTAKGSLITASAANTPVELAAGADDRVLVADSAADEGMAYRPATIDADGNVATPGRVRAGTVAAGSAEMTTHEASSLAWADFGHSAAPAPALSQRSDGVAAFLRATLAVVTGVGARIPLYATENGARCQGPLGSNTGPGTSMALQVSGGFLFMPRLETTDRDSLAAAASFGSDHAGAMCFNTTVGRLELWNGSAWVGLTTEA